MLRKRLLLAKVLLLRRAGVTFVADGAATFYT